MSGNKMLHTYLFTDQEALKQFMNKFESSTGLKGMNPIIANGYRLEQVPMSGYS